MEIGLSMGAPPCATAGRAVASCDCQDRIKQSPFPKGPTSPLVPAPRLFSRVRLLLCPSSQRCRAGRRSQEELLGDLAPGQTPGTILFYAPMTAPLTRSIAPAHILGSWEQANSSRACSLDKQQSSFIDTK